MDNYTIIQKTIGASYDGEVYSYDYVLSNGDRTLGPIRVSKAKTDELSLDTRGEECTFNLSGIAYGYRLINEDILKEFDSQMEKLVLTNATLKKEGEIYNILHSDSNVNLKLELLDLNIEYSMETIDIEITYYSLFFDNLGN